MKKNLYSTVISAVLRVVFSISLLLLLLSTSCDDPDLTSPLNDYPVLSVDSEEFEIGPQGALIEALNQKVTLLIPEFAVPSLTTLTVKYGPSLSLDNTASVSYVISMENTQLQRPLTLTLNYENTKYYGQAGNESDLVIYRLDNAATSMMESFSKTLFNCCVDKSCHTVSGCMDKTGIFVVGINHF
ncbi:hypothetical protein [Maribellus mangrovi]|uniref:hypothetical protein n=1 Tax=Maribellus mangrovi TaxID=3133146 RepID=UPI0030EE9CA1